MSDLFEKLSHLLPAMFFGVGLALVGVWAGWTMATSGKFVVVRLIDRWVELFVLPLVKSESWLTRFAGILANNATLCAIVVAAGATRPTAIAAVASLGFTLGVGFHLLGRRAGDMTLPESAARTPRVSIGLALNMLELLAIVVALGLCLGQGVFSGGIEGAIKWHMFGLMVLPLLVLAAAGEGMWLGAVGPTENPMRSSRDDDDLPI